MGILIEKSVQGEEMAVPRPSACCSLSRLGQGKSRRDGCRARQGNLSLPHGPGLPARLIPSQAKEETRHGSRESKQDHSCVDEELSGRHRRGLAARHQTLRGATGFEVLSPKGKVENGKITEYRVMLEVTFILD